MGSGFRVQGFGFRVYGLEFWLWGLGFGVQVTGARRGEGHDAVERLRENLADFNEKLFKNLYQNRLDGQVTGHVLVQFFLNS